MISQRKKRILVKPKKGRALSVRDYVPGATLLRIRKNGLQVVEIPDGLDQEECCHAVCRCPEVQYAEPDYKLKASLTSDDPKFLAGDQWGLLNVGQDGGLSGADISAPQSWDIRNTAASIIVAVIDTGALLTHSDLEANLWTNPDETEDGTDSDGNGIVDDIHGFNAITGSGDSTDDNGHGTHVAGIIGAVGNNATGITGVAWTVQLMILKFLEADGEGLTSDAIECIDYAIEKGAHIINASWSGTSFSEALKEALVDAQTAGILVAAAAGNDGTDNDTTPVYPASYELSNIISVAATTRTEELHSTSNYGKTSVDLGAPGHEIVSTWFDGGYKTQSGTSMAAAFVAGAAAILKAQHPSETYRITRNRILNGVDVVSSYTNKFVTNGRLNLLSSLTISVQKEILVDYRWPSSVPLPFIDYSGNPRHTTITSPADASKILRRNRYTASYVTINARWVLDQSQMDVFEDFFISKLNNGIAKFAIDLRYPKNSALTEWLVQFSGGYDAQWQDGVWEISASLNLIHEILLNDIAALLGYTGFLVLDEESGGGYESLITLDGFEVFVKV